MKKIYISGCGGMLGEAFYRCFREGYGIKCTDIDVNENWIGYMDTRDYEAYRRDVTGFRPDYLFHLAAYTDLEFCEIHPDETYLTNTLAVENAVLIANRLDIPLLYISSAGIFDGKQEVYDDWDRPGPLGVYARSKYMGERFVVENARRYLVCRAGWMMGGGPDKDKKFVQKIMAQLKAGKKELHVVSDKDGTPTYTHDFARNTRLLVEEELWGLYNLVCGGQTSRLEVAEAMIELLGLKDEVKITPVDSDYFKETYFARRPPSERLINRKLNLRGLNRMRGWKEALDDYLKSYYRDYL